MLKIEKNNIKIKYFIYSKIKIALSTVERANLPLLKHYTNTCIKLII